MLVVDFAHLLRKCETLIPTASKQTNGCGIRIATSNRPSEQHWRGGGFLCRPEDLLNKKSDLHLHFHQKLIEIVIFIEIPVDKKIV
jgi:hypothetical protein